MQHTIAYLPILLAHNITQHISKARRQARGGRPNHFSRSTYHPPVPTRAESASFKRCAVAKKGGVGERERERERDT